MSNYRIIFLLLARLRSILTFTKNKLDIIDLKKNNNNAIITNCKMLNNIMNYRHIHYYSISPKKI